MARRVIRFGDERDKCFSCRRPIERCGEMTTICTYTEATQHNKELRKLTGPYVKYEGIKEEKLDYPVYGYSDYLK